jgi:hypothetical protein
LSLGYDVYEDNRDFEQKGLTGDVRRYTTSSMKFPCYVLVNSEEKPVKSYSIDTLRQMFPALKQYDETLTDSMIHIYFNQDDKTVRLGAILGSQVKTFLKLFENNDIDGYISKDEKLEGMYLYVLSD